MANRMNNNRKNTGGIQRRPMGGAFYNNRDNFNRPRFSPWQGGVVPNSGGGGNMNGGNMNGGGGNMNGNVGPDTFALANNLLNMLQTRPNPMPSLLDINVRRDFRDGYSNNRFPSKMYDRNLPLGGQTNRRVMSARNDRPINKIRRPMRPNIANKAKSVPKTNQEKKDPPESKPATVTTESIKVEIKEENQENSEYTLDVEMSETPNEDAGEEKTGTKDDKKSEGVKTEFDDIASKFLECHICEKRMWDGRSFDNHIKGRVHNLMMEKTKQSYHMTAGAMRQELKICEMKRTKRGYIPGAKKVFCAMCDLQVFYAAAHRRSPGHQKLKKYLHPSCNTCRKEFPTRIELDEHRLTAPHLRLLQEKSKDVQIRAKPEVIMITTLQEETAQVRPMHEAKKVQVKKENDETTEGAVKEETITDVKEEVEESPEDKVLLLDYKEGDDLTVMTRENLPRYQTDRPVGISYMTDFTCKHCTLCKKYFDTEETAEVHLRTWKHFQAFIRLVHSKGNFKVNQDTNQNQSTDDLSEETDSKRRKLETDEDILIDNIEEAINACEESLNLTEAEENSLLNETVDEPAIDSTAELTLNDTDTSLQSTNETKPAPKSQKAVRGRGRGRGRGNWGKRGYNRT